MTMTQQIMSILRSDMGGRLQVRGETVIHTGHRHTACQEKRKLAVTSIR